MRDAYIIDGARTAVGKANRGALAQVRPDVLGADLVRGLMARQTSIDPNTIDDVIIGTAMPEQEQGFNLARIVALSAGIPDSVPAMTVNRFCSTGLQTIALAADRIRTGDNDLILAGGVESMSFLPFNPNQRMVPNPDLADSNPDAYLSMGLTAENVAERYKISREDADALAFESHQRALKAIDNGNFVDEILALSLPSTAPGADAICFKVDEGPRADTTLEKLATLKPVFKRTGVVTAGNSSQTSDGAAAVLVGSKETATRAGLTPLARFRGFAVAGVAPELMGIGPVSAIPKLLKQTGVSLNDIAVIELNEAFAVQALAVIRELELDPAKVNVNGGAIALGHPLGCTGTKLTLTLIHELKRRGGGLGLVTMCVGGGMGAAGLIEVSDF